MKPSQVEYKKNARNALFRYLSLLFILPFISVGSFAQMKANKEEVQETLRFIRIAETQRQLNFSEEKLLKINRILDQYEAKKLDLAKQYRALKQKLKKETPTESEAIALLTEYRKVKQMQSEQDLALFDQIQAFLDPLETIQFIAFHDTLRRKIGRRINMLQDKKRPRNRVSRRNR
ncbi:MAG: hypothetical protein CR997_01165 [Acidobacteria bacterium]|nr:MAG: hypothetical protein CR997_01165 [Acidobacteriota bacterium]